MTKVFANNHNATFASNNFALIANLLNAWLHLHGLLLRNYLFTCNGKRFDLL
jgi:hypothetical protein